MFKDLVKKYKDFIKKYKETQKEIKITENTESKSRYIILDDREYYIKKGFFYLKSGKDGEPNMIKIIGYYPELKNKKKESNDLPIVQYDIYEKFMNGEFDVKEEYSIFDYILGTIYLIISIIWILSIILSSVIKHY